MVLRLSVLRDNLKVSFFLIHCLFRDSIHLKYFSLGRDVVSQFVVLKMFTLEPVKYTEVLFIWRLNEINTAHLWLFRYLLLYTVYTSLVQTFKEPCFLRPGENMCESNTCEHICLLSSAEEQGWSCVCATGYILNEDGTTCSSKPLMYDISMTSHTLY